MSRLLRVDLARGARRKSVKRRCMERKTRRLMTEAVVMESNISILMLASNQSARKSNSKSKGTPTTDVADTG